MAQNCGVCVTSYHQDKVYIIWDDTIKGFGCKIHSSKKTFAYYYRSPNNRKFSYITIGVYGSITVDEARIQAKKFAHSVQIEKIDPKELKKVKQVEAQQSILFEDFLTIFLEKYPKQARWASSTAQNHSYLIKLHILPFFRKKQIVDIKRKDILEFSDLLHNKKLNNKKCLDLLSTIFKQAVLLEYMSSHGNPCDSVHKDGDKKMENYLTDEQLEKLEKVLMDKENASAISKYAIDAFRLLIYTGCRLGEALSLEWESIDFDHQCLRLKHSKTGKRTIPLNNSAITVLRNVQKKDDNHYVFCGSSPGKHLINLKHAWQSIRVEAGIPEFRIHDLRHSFASFMIKNGVSLFELSKLLGHKNLNTTMRYAHLTDQSLVEVTNKGGKMFEANNKYRI